MGTRLIVRKLDCSDGRSRIVVPWFVIYYGSVGSDAESVMMHSISQAIIVCDALSCTRM